MRHFTARRAEVRRAFLFAKIGGQMKVRRWLFATLIVCLVSSTAALRAQSEITLLSPNPITEPLNKIVANFQAKTGIQVKITYGTGVSTRNTVASGQALD